MQETAMERSIVIDDDIRLRTHAVNYGGVKID